MQAIIIKNITLVDFVKHLLFNNKTNEKQTVTTQTEEIKDWKRVEIKWE